MRFINLTLSNEVGNANSKTKQDIWAATSGVRAQSKTTKTAQLLLMVVSAVPRTAQQPKHREPRDEN